MKAFASVLALVAALVITSCTKPDPTAAIEKSITAVHDSLMNLDGHATALVGLLKTEAGKIDTAMPAKVAANKKKEVEEMHVAAVAKMAVFMKDAEGLESAQKAMQEWMAAYATKPAAETAAAEKLTWYNEQLSGVQNLATTMGSAISAAEATLTGAGVQVPAKPEAAPAAAAEGEAKSEEGHQ
jgi:hypothetical protein